MLYPIAIEHGDEQHAYGVVVPDIQGCFSAGDTFEEALLNAKEAIMGHLEILAEGGTLPPVPSDAGKYIDEPDYKGWLWALVEIDTEPYMGKSEKINVTLPKLLLLQIQEEIKENQDYKNRSNFLQLAALHELKQARSNQESA